MTEIYQIGAPSATIPTPPELNVDAKDSRKAIAVRRADSGHALEIRVTLTNGQMMRFAIDDADAANRYLSEIRPARLFAEEMIMIGGDTSLTVLPTATIERIDFMAEDAPSWPYLGSARDVLEVSAAKFREIYDSRQYAEQRKLAAATPGTEQIGFTEHWTKSGLQFYWQVRMLSTSLTSMDFRPYIQSLLTSNGLHARTADGSVTVVNPANLTRITFLPGPPTLPAGTWLARRL